MTQAGFERIDVEKALEELTQNEKIQLTSGADFWHTVRVERLGIPSVRLSDGPNGARGTRFFDSVPANCVPCGTALGATWDAELLREVGRFLGQEAKAKGAHVLLGPTINIQRSPLNGRGFESFAEDPLLSGTIAGHYCLGLQDEKIIATPKHLVCNDKENERFGSDSVVTERALREIYLTPFQIALGMARPGAIMTAYNKVNGTHANESKTLLQDILRGEWGFNGMVMSDWYDPFKPQLHETKRKFGTYSTVESINAGADLEMPGPSRFRGDILDHVILAKKVQKHTLDERVRNVLNLVNEASASGVPDAADEKTRDTPETRAFMRKVASNSVVLLKNEGSILPFDKNKPVLVIGPNSKITTYAGGGSAGVNATYTVTPYDGVCNVSKAEVAWTQGVYSHRTLPDLGPRLRTPDGQPGLIWRAYNEPPTASVRNCVDERHLRKTESHLSDYKNEQIAGDAWYATSQATFTPDESGLYDFGVVVIGSGKLYIDGEVVVDNTHGQKKGSMFFGMATEEVIGSKELSAGTPYSIVFEWGSTPTGDLALPNSAEKNGAFRIGCAKRLDYDISIKQAMDLASTHEQVVVFAGLSGEWETESVDREHMDLPPGSDDLIKAVLAANSNAVVCIQSGTPVTMPWAEDVNALVWASYGGCETGNGIADVLYGEVNPCAKLPLTFPRRVQDSPAFLNFGVDGGRILYGEDIYVGYRYYEKAERDVLFMFGHGLSYTTFSREDLQLTRDGHKLNVSVTVTNTGGVAGAEIVQLYILPPCTSSVGRPPRELKAFKKVALDVGESRSVEFELDVQRVTSFFDELRHEVGPSASRSGRGESFCAAVRA
ncbi:hypothetical protein KEM56_000498 [Ascosphaera pollenicola]|nr:hypothetical protein KEM56_000498 [Ascosphaera pollenicola]